MIRRLYMTAALCLLLPALALAQTAEPSIDWKDVGAKAILGLTSVVTLLAVQGLKAAWAKIPAASVFIVAPVFGILVDFGINYLSGHVPSDPLLAAVFGLLAIVLNEAKTTVQAKGVLGGFSK